MCVCKADWIKPCIYTVYLTHSERIATKHDTAQQSTMTLITLKHGTLAVAFACIAACGSSSTTTTTPAASSTGLSTAAQAYLDLNLNQLSNYANPVLPAHYDSDVTDNTPANNRASDKLATLGRVLFFDKRLSVNNTVACASCHQAANGFSDKTRLSIGFSGSQFTTAHAMRLGNSRYYRPGTMFWDKRAASLESQASQPIIHPVEMGFDTAAGGIPALITKMNTSAYYPELFQFAFGDPAITEDRTQKALAQFERSLISSNSKWDSAYATVYNFNAPNKNLALSLAGAGFTASEERGRVLFMSPAPAGVNCVSCHNVPTFALGPASLSNGLDLGETRIFKAPSLKNVALDSAFMHDGRFASLEAVIEHYNSGVQEGPALDARLKNPAGTAPRRLNLSAADKTALVDFLKTLNDTVLTTDAKFASPFKP